MVCDLHQAEAAAMERCAVPPKEETKGRALVEPVEGGFASRLEGWKGDNIGCRAHGVVQVLDA